MASVSVMRLIFPRVRRVRRAPGGAAPDRGVSVAKIPAGVNVETMLYPAHLFPYAVKM
jgi:hypothetical protein